jgi:phosphatidylserine/phosphatidylglycerophosphate/cardiolipin synthase-like enzyme
VTFLANQGIPVRLNSHYAIMHNKYMVIDGQSVQTGSFNYTAGANKRNAENVILLKDVPDMANKYLTDFEKLYSEGKEFGQPNKTSR